MRVLFLTQVLPYPLDAGPKTRAYYVLRHLARRHEVTLLSFVREEDRPEHLNHLRGFCQAVHTVPMTRSRLRDLRAFIASLTTGRPLVICRDRVPEMTRLICRELTAGNYDAIHADQISMAQYGLLANKPTNTPTTILDAHNALYLVFQRLAQHEPNPVKRRLLQREARLLAGYEAQTCQQYDRVVFVTDQDRQAVLEQIRNPKSEIRDSTIPICIDPAEKRLIQQIPRPHRVTFLGALHWPPNAEGVLWFTREVWPRVQREMPEAALTIIGKNPPPELTQLASRNSHPVPRNVEVAGYVEDPAAFLSETAAFIVPLHSAGGMRVKILDAWCWGLPIVSTNIGAEGIEHHPGENILIADEPAPFAEAIIRLFRRPQLAEALRRNGRRWVEQHYNWRTVYRQWDAVYETVGHGDTVTRRGGDGVTEGGGRNFAVRCAFDSATRAKQS